MSGHYAKEKFYLATLALVSGVPGIKERLEGAALAIHSLRAESDLPVHLHSEFQHLWRDLTSEPAEISGEGKIHATIRQMDDNEASSVAERIFSIYLQLLNTAPL